MTTKDTYLQKTVTDNPAPDDKDAAKLTFIIPPSYTSFIVVAIGWLYLCIGSVREFLASHYLFNAIFVSYLTLLFVYFVWILNQYEVRLGKSVKCDLPFSGLIAVLAIAFASFVHYETFYFGQDCVYLWYYYFVVLPVGFFWWILIIVCMVMIAPCGFFINEEAVRKFLSEHPLAKPDQSGQVGGEASIPPNPAPASNDSNFYNNEDSTLSSSSPPTELHDSDYPSIVIDHKAEHEPDRELAPKPIDSLSNKVGSRKIESTNKNIIVYLMRFATATCLTQALVIITVLLIIFAYNYAMWHIDIFLDNTEQIAGNIFRQIVEISIYSFIFSSTISLAVLGGNLETQNSESKPPPFIYRSIMFFAFSFLFMSFSKISEFFTGISILSGSWSFLKISISLVFLILSFTGGIMFYFLFLNNTSTKNDSKKT